MREAVGKGGDRKRVMRTWVPACSGGSNVEASVVDSETTDEASVWEEDEKAPDDAERGAALMPDHPT